MLLPTVSAPDLVEAILDGRQGGDVKLDAVMEEVRMVLGEH